MLRKGLSIPREISPKTMERMLKIIYTTIFPLYLDRYCKITENFFMLKSVNLCANLTLIPLNQRFAVVKGNLNHMQEGKRQKQVGALLTQELSDIFQRLGLGMIDGGMVSLTAVKVTPDLLEARIYLSFFQVKDIPATMKKIEDRGWEI